MFCFAIQYVICYLACAVWNLLHLYIKGPALLFLCVIIYVTLWYETPCSTSRMPSGRVVHRSRVSESWCRTIAYNKLQDLITIPHLVLLSMPVPTNQLINLYTKAYMTGYMVSKLCVGKIFIFITPSRLQPTKDNYWWFSISPIYTSTATM